MTLGEIVKLVCSTVGKSDDNMKTYVRSVAKQRYQMIYDAALWKDSQIVIDKTGVTTAEVILPYIAERAVMARTNTGLTLPPTELGYVFQVDPQTFERLGDPIRYSELPPVAVQTAPGGTAVRVTSSNASDSGQTVLIRGLLAGEQYEEMLTLNGTTWVNGVQLWDVIDTLSIDAHAGAITVQQLTGSNLVLLKLTASELEKKFARIWLQQLPINSQDFKLLVKRKCVPLVRDQDSPILRNCDNALIAATRSEAFKKMRQYAKAATEFQEANAFAQIMIDEERNQSGHVSQIVPDVEPTYNRDFGSAGLFR
jgi:hypothetical protein